MFSQDPLNILIVEKSHDEANRYSSILRSADYQVDAKLAGNHELRESPRAKYFPADPSQ